MVDEKFIEGIGDIVHSGMVVRFDLLALDPSTRDNEGNMQPALRQRVVMPVDAFVRAVDKLGKSLPQLEKMGVLKRQAIGNAGEVHTPAAADSSGRSAPTVPEAVRTLAAATGTDQSATPGTERVGTLAAAKAFDRTTIPESKKTKPLAAANGVDRNTPRPTEKRYSPGSPPRIPRFGDS